HQEGSLAAYLKESFCSVPFEHFETTPSQDVYLCCPAWLPRPIGNLARANWGDIWRGSAAEEIRRSIRDGSFKYCSPISCPKIASGTLEKRDQVDAPQLAAGAAAGPRVAVLSHDRSCNLSCPSCRKTQIVVPKSEQAQFDDLTERTLIPLIEASEEVAITGS